MSVEKSGSALDRSCAVRTSPANIKDACALAWLHLVRDWPEAPERVELALHAGAI